MDPPTVGVLVWGTFVGLDLVSGPQIMAARPIVAGTVTGWILGDTAAGFAVGTMLELFALEIMPFGSARYADYGLGAVVAAVVAAGTPGVLAVGLGIGVGTVVAMMGDAGTNLVRRMNSADAQKVGAALESGDARTVCRLHYRSIGRDALRGLVIVAVGLFMAGLIRGRLTLPISAAVGASVAAIGVAFGTGFASAIRYGRASPNGVLFFVVGVAGGALWLSLA